MMPRNDAKKGVTLREILNPKPTDLTQDIKVGDTIRCFATGYLREVKVTKITPTYVWVEYTSPSTGIYHNTKFRRFKHDTTRSH